MLRLFLYLIFREYFLLVSSLWATVWLVVVAGRGWCRCPQKCCSVSVGTSAVGLEDCPGLSGRREPDSCLPAAHLQQRSPVNVMEVIGGELGGGTGRDRAFTSCEKLILILKEKLNSSFDQLFQLSCVAKEEQIFLAPITVYSFIFLFINKISKLYVLR